ncbi:MAG: glycosyltransferase family 4 protein [Candidatus Diapherotrites archaeon]|nr:glycosyltransferase family 4 protein [Candidatus Diapherotrites archaeon]
MSEKKFKIVHVLHHFEPCKGGIESVTLNLCRQLKKKGHSVEVVCLNKCPHGTSSLPPEETIEGIVVHRVPFLDLKWYKCPFHVMEKIPRDADIVHVHGLGFFSDLLAWNRKRFSGKLVLSTHGGIFHSNSSVFKQMYFNFIARRTLRAFDKVIAVSEHDGTLFKRIIPVEKMIVIENGVDVAQFNPNHERDEDAFLFVGRFSENKRVELLVETLLEALPQEPKIKLWLAGIDWNEALKHLRERVRALGIQRSVEFFEKPSNEKLKTLYERAGHFVSASAYEGFGLSLVEGMGAGCIAIVQGIESFERILDHEKNGFLVDYSNPEQVAHEWVRIRDLDRKNKEGLRVEARRRALEFDWSKKVGEFEQVYMEVKGP